MNMKYRPLGGHWKWVTWLASIDTLNTHLRLRRLKSNIILTLSLYQITSFVPITNLYFIKYNISMQPFGINKYNTKNKLFLRTLKLKVASNSEL